MKLDRDSLIQSVLFTLPAVVILPFIFSTPLGIKNHAAVEIAGFFNHYH